MADPPGSAQVRREGPCPCAIFLHSAGEGWEACAGRAHQGELTYTDFLIEESIHLGTIGSDAGQRTRSRSRLRDNRGRTYVDLRNSGHREFRPWRVLRHGRLRLLLADSSWCELL